MKAAFAARVNLVTQVTEVTNFSRMSRIGTEAHEKIASLQCLEKYQQAF